MPDENLVIVESPTKARTIKKYLGQGVEVLSSKGHIRDLPKKELGVDIENGFEPKLVTTDNKSIRKLRKEAAKAKQVYLATDNDREGEAIAYDLFQVVGSGKDGKYRRVVFNEITKEVIQESIKNPSNIDMNKVEAQRARRILDRLVGYLVSPLLSISVSGSQRGKFTERLSAGRVQSVSLRLITDREQAIQEFEPEEYWEIEVTLENSSQFTAQLHRIKGEKPSIESAEEVKRIVEDLRRSDFEVTDIDKKDKVRTPLPPFITSTMQRAASSVLGFSPQRTMRVAQQLYEGIDLGKETVGLITYMRTDSPRVSSKAQGELRNFIEKEYGDKYLAPTIRKFKKKKGSQDAHEAIRPTSVLRIPSKIRKYLTKDQHKLYTLIWDRFVATQMANAKYKRFKVKIGASDYLFRVTASQQIFDGFLKILKLKPLKDEGVTIPTDLKVGDKITLVDINPEQNFTKPPNRYSDASLIKILEKEGIGRPSTYASIVSTIQKRNYTGRVNGSLRPTLLGFVAVDFLKHYFPKTVQVKFTAEMEESLDKIREGKLTRLELLRSFYRPFGQQVEKVEKELTRNGSPFQVLTNQKCDKCGAPMEVKYWKGTRYLGCSNYPKCKNTLEFPVGVEYKYKDLKVILPDDLKEKQEEEEEETGITCPNCGAPMQIKRGKYGRFYGCSRYPECKTTEPLYVGVPCPRCEEGDLVERYSRKRKSVFYGCTNFPDCRFAVGKKPHRICPKCDQGVLVADDDGDKLICSDKKCDYQEDLKTGEKLEE